MRAIVTQRESAGPHGGLIDSLEREYVEFLTSMGFDVFPLSSFAPGASRYAEVVAPDLIVFTGGGIVQAAAYRSEVSGPFQVERDQVEDELFRFAVAHDVPVLGICRGMQKLNAFFGGTVGLSEGLPVPRAVRENHPVELVGGETFAVNHFHNGVVLVDDVGEGLEPIAFDADNGVVEALRAIDGTMLGVQWHPERMGEHDRGRTWVVEMVGALVAKERRALCPS